MSCVSTSALSLVSESQIQQLSDVASAKGMTQNMQSTSVCAVSWRKVADGVGARGSSAVALENFCDGSALARKSTKTTEDAQSNLETF